MDGKEAADTLLAAMAAQVAAIADPLGGVQDGQRLALPGEEPMREADAAEDSFLQARLAKIEAARVAVSDLLEHGFPALPEREVDAATIALLDLQVRQAQAARARFKQREASAGTVAFAPSDEG